MSNQTPGENQEVEKKETDIDSFFSDQPVPVRVHKTLAVCESCEG